MEDSNAPDSSRRLKTSRIETRCRSRLGGRARITVPDVSRGLLRVWGPRMTTALGGCRRHGFVPGNIRHESSRTAMLSYFSYKSGTPSDDTLKRHSARRRMLDTLFISCVVCYVKLQPSSV